MSWRRLGQRAGDQRLGGAIELGAGLAAGALALLALGLLLFAPVLPSCSTAARPCPAADVHYETLLQAHLAPDAWAFVLAPALFALAGAAGAFADARYSIRTGVVPLGVAAGLNMLLCLLGTAGLVAVVYFPATLALALAVYGAFLHRFAAGAATSSGAGADDPAGS
jgi:hypothetical protein